jgi:hypothetical protein
MATSVFNQGACLSGDTVVTSAGTAVALETAKIIGYHSVGIVAKLANTGKIFLGGSDVSSSTMEGLAAGSAWSIKDESKAHGINLSDIYIDASVNGDGVDFVASM